MPSVQHEALHRIFQERPSLFSRAFRVLDIPFPETSSVAVVNTDLTEILPVERRVDTLLDVKSAMGEHLIVIESQSRPDEDKPPAWAYYIGYLHAKHRCDVVLIVICQSAATARWAREPKEIGLPGRPTMVIHPIALGPDNVPAVTDLAVAAQDVVLAVFSALTHGRSRTVSAILETLAAALDTIDVDDAGYLAEFMEVGLGDTKARQLWRGLMSTKTYRYQSEFAQQLRTEGRAEGRAASILLLLRGRGIPVSDEARARIESCTDVKQLESWLLRAMTVISVEELLGDRP